MLSIYYAIRKICFRKNDSKRKTGNPHVDKFNEASRKFEKDIDFINILKTLKHSQLMYHVLLSDYQRILGKMQYENLIHSEDYSESSEDLG